MIPALVHQTGMQTNRKWKNYYHKKKVSEENNNQKS